MRLTIELPDDLDGALRAQARARAVSTAGFARQVLEKALKSVESGSDEEKPDQPFETGYGMWAKYGTAPSAEQIDENRRDMFRNFAQDL
jgi:plasmid stability protein